MRTTVLLALALAGALATPSRAQTVIFHEDFETGIDAWSATGLWNWEHDTDPCGATRAPFPAGSGGAYFGRDGFCDYDLGYGSSAGGSLSLLQPIALPTNATRATLRFRYSISLEPYDSEEITCWDQASASVGGPGPIWVACRTEGIPGPGWHDAELDIT